VLATVSSIARGIGKMPVVVGVCFGFVGNRMLLPRIGQARKKMLLEGLFSANRRSCTEVWHVGPLAMEDLAGLDIGCVPERQR